MRARSLKPGLLKNEILGSADPLYTILFEGLWLMADRDGRLEDRPLRICAEVFPYRRKISEKRVDEMLWWLDEQGFIARYENSVGRFIEVLHFSKHQNPHQDERRSVIQGFRPDLHRTRTMEARCERGKSTKVVGLTPSSLTPDSGLLTPDSLNTATPCGREGENAEGKAQGNKRQHPPPINRGGEPTHRPPEPMGAAAQPDAPDPGVTALLTEDETREQFDTVLREYGEVPRWFNRALAERNCRLLIERRGQTWSTLRAKARDYREHCDSGGISSPARKMNPEKFFEAAEDGPWSHPWRAVETSADIAKAKAAKADAEKLEALRESRSERGLPDFRDPHPHESPQQYETALRIERNSRGLVLAGSPRFPTAVADLVVAKTVKS